MGGGDFYQQFAIVTANLGAHYCIASPHPHGCRNTVDYPASDRPLLAEVSHSYYEETTAGVTAI